MNKNKQNWIEKRKDTMKKGKKSEVEDEFDQLLATIDAKKSDTKIQLLAMDIQHLKPIINLMDTDLGKTKPSQLNTHLPGRQPNTKRTAIKAEVVEENDKKKAKLDDKRRKVNAKMYSKSGVPLSVLAPTIKSSKVADIQDPKKDGNCGFRCLALAIHGNEEQYVDIKAAMMEQLNTNKANYLAWGCLINDDIARMEKILQHHDSCGPEFWFVDPEMS